RLIVTRVHKYLLLSVCLFLSFTTAVAQSDPGLPAFGTFTGGSFDTINLGNLNIHLEVPVINKPGPGMPIHYSLVYDRGGFAVTGAKIQDGWEGLASDNRPAAALTGTLHYTQSFVTCDFRLGYQYVRTIFDYYIDPSGTKHRFPFNSVML